MKIIIFITSLIMFYSSIISGQENERVTILGDSLIGAVTNGENIRRVLGDVVITQGKVKVTCDLAIQHLEQNNVELFGNIVATQDSVTMFGKRGFYFGNTKTAYADSGVLMNDGHVILKADRGYYYFNEKKADFYNNVELFDSLSTLYSDRLYYFNDENKAIAGGHVFLADSSSVINADSMISFRNKNITLAFSNVKIQNPENDFIITSNKMENYGNEKYTLISENPLFTKVDTTTSGRLDTLYLKSNTMTYYQDSTQKFIAKDSVQIVRGNFSSSNRHTIYYKNSGTIFTFRKEDELRQPILWSDNSQLLGDSIYIYLEKNVLDRIKILHNASIISKNKAYNFRYDQISGDTLTLNFKSDFISRTNVTGGVLSIYYLFNDTKPNGLVKVSSERAIVLFMNNRVNEIKMYGDPKSEYHPENLIKGKEKEFTLPTFIIYKNRPTKNSITKIFN